MNRMSVLVATTVTALVVAAVAVTGAVVSGSDDDGMPWGRGMMGPAGEGQAWSSGTDEPDFLVEMIAHHRDAVTSAAELARSERPEMRALGASIVASQTEQIDQMTSWLRSWYPDEPQAADYRPMMPDLADLEGDELDRTFLEHMIPHHHVAVMMSHRLLMGGTEHDDLASLAQEIQREQRREIGWMQGRLQEWFDAGWHAGMWG